MEKKNNEHSCDIVLNVLLIIWLGKESDPDEEDEEELHLGAIGAEGDATEKTLSGMGGQ